MNINQCFDDGGLLTIMSFLDVASLGRCHLVCQKWKQIAGDHTLWRAACYDLLLNGLSEGETETFHKVATDVAALDEKGAVNQQAEKCLRIDPQQCGFPNEPTSWQLLFSHFLSAHIVDPRSSTSPPSKWPKRYSTLSRAVSAATREQPFIYLLPGLHAAYCNGGGGVRTDEEADVCNKPVKIRGLGRRPSDVVISPAATLEYRDTMLRLSGWCALEFSGPPSPSSARLLHRQRRKEDLFDGDAENEDEKRWVEHAVGYTEEELTELLDETKENSLNRPLLKGVKLLHDAGHAICIGRGSSVIIKDCEFENNPKEEEDEEEAKEEETTSTHDEAEHDSAREEETRDRTTVALEALLQGRIISASALRSGGSCVNIFGSQTDTILYRCKILNAGKHGIFIGEEATACVIDSSVSNTEHSGVHARSLGRALIRSCSIQNCQHHGVFVNEDGIAVVEDSTISDVAGDGVHVFDSNEGAEQHRQRAFCKQRRNVLRNCAHSKVGPTTSASDCIIA
ncbi:hypothetical protein QOT17_022321 [Balamuthia mandrillaris]